MTGFNSAARAVIYILGAVLIILTVAAVVLAYQDKSLPDKLVDLLQTVIVGLLALLARTGNDAHPQAVEVVNRPSDPVPTTDAPKMPPPLFPGSRPTETE